MEAEKRLKIRDVLAKKYGFSSHPRIESPPIIMNEELTVGEFKEVQNELKERDCQIGVNLATAVVVLGRTKKLPLMSILLYNHLRTIFFIITIALFFVNWVYGVLSIIFTIKEFIAPFYRYKLRAKIVKLVLTDYESLYMLLATNSISIKDR